MVPMVPMVHVVSLVLVVLKVSRVCMVPVVSMAPVTITASGMHRRIPFRSTLNTSYITALDMCEVCTEAVHSVALSQHELHHSFGHV